MSEYNVPVSPSIGGFVEKHEFSVINGGIVTSTDGSLERVPAGGFSIAYENELTSMSVPMSKSSTLRCTKLLYLMGTEMTLSMSESFLIVTIGRNVADFAAL